MKVAFITLGCKVNQYESNAMCEEFIKHNYQIVDKEEKADICVVNTCTVTNMSDRKSRQMLRRVKEINPQAIIVACGCYVQVAKDELEQMPEIDLVLGNNEKKEIVKYVEEFIANKQKIELVEVVITGIHVASYGKDFDNNYRLIDLLEDINKIDGIERIRLGSVEPLLITEEFLDRLTKLEKICHHFHLSLQSGCDETLKRMNRRYTTKEFKHIVDLLRNAYNDVILTTDIIVGFPEETDEEFNQTYQFLSEIKFYKMHIFKYSPRKGTPAARNKNQVDGNKKEERSNKLIELSNKNEEEYNKQLIGKKVSVLFEEEKTGLYKGHTQNYILIYCNSEKDLSNKIIEVKCEKLENNQLFGKISTM